MMPLPESNLPNHLSRAAEIFQRVTSSTMGYDRYAPLGLREVTLPANELEVLPVTGRGVRVTHLPTGRCFTSTGGCSRSENTNDAIRHLTADVREHSARAHAAAEEQRRQTMRAVMPSWGTGLSFGAQTYTRPNTAQGTQAGQGAQIGCGDIVRTAQHMDSMNVPIRPEVYAHIDAMAADRETRLSPPFLTLLAQLDGLVGAALADPVKRAKLDEYAVKWRRAVDAYERANQ